METNNRIAPTSQAGSVLRSGEIIPCADRKNSCHSINIKNDDSKIAVLLTRIGNLSVLLKIPLIRRLCKIFS